MTTDLFPGMPQSLSPRLAWYKKHELMSMPIEPEEPGPDEWAVGYARDFDNPLNLAGMGFGKTEAEAEFAFAEKAKLCHWSVEPEIKI